MKASMRVGGSGRSRATAIAAVIVSLWTVASLAEEPVAWPTHTVRIVVGYPAGSSPDTVARLVADPLGRSLGKPVVVENRPGAAGSLGVETVVQSTDGHTFGFTTSGPLTTATLLFKKLPYDPARDVLPIALAATSPLVLVCDADLPPKSLHEFVAWARGQAHGVTYGSAGIGMASHLTMELFARKAGFHVVHVPYQGMQQVATALLGHQVQAAFMPPSGAIAQAGTGKLRMLAVSSSQRWPSSRELPVLADAMGIGDLRTETWIGAFAPVTMPAYAAARLSVEIQTILQQPDLREKLGRQGWHVVGGGPDELRRRIAHDTAAWTRVIREAKVPAQ